MPYTHFDFHAHLAPFIVSVDPIDLFSTLGSAHHGITGRQLSHITLPVASFLLIFHVGDGGEGSCESNRLVGIVVVVNQRLVATAP